MPRKNQVHTLVDLALYSIGEFVIAFGKYLIKYIYMISKTNPMYGHIKLQSMLKFMKHLFLLFVVYAEDHDTRIETTMCLLFLFSLLFSRTPP